MPGLQLFKLGFTLVNSYEVTNLLWQFLNELKRSLVALYYRGSTLLCVHPL
jgi:hypothetical protein